MIPLSSIQSLADHVRAGKALCTHDDGWRLAEILDQLLANQRETIHVKQKTLADVVEKHCGRAA